MDRQPEPTLTHKHLAKALGVTVTTVKSYRRKFPEFWKVASQGKPIRFTAESLELCRRIRHHFKLGLSVEATRQRLAAEFEAVVAPPAYTGVKTQAEEAHENHDTLARMEALMEGLFTLQNRTHSLMAELVAKLDTLADRLGEAGAEPAGRQAGSQRQEASPGGAVRQPQRPDTGGLTTAGRSREFSASQAASGDRAAAGGPATGSSGTVQTPAPAGLRAPGHTLTGLSAAGKDSAEVSAAYPVHGPSSVNAEVSGRAATEAAGGVGSHGAPPDASTISGPADKAGAAVPAGTRPPQDMLDMPVTVRTPEGEYLGVIAPGGQRFTLSDMETYLAVRLSGAAWTRSGDDWLLEGVQSGETARYRFHKEVTPRGNTVVRLAAVSSGAEELTFAALQALLRQVKESLG